MRGLQGKVRPGRRRGAGQHRRGDRHRLAEEGTAVVAADLHESAARAIVDEIQALGGKAIARSFDITDEASYKELVDATVREFGRPSHTGTRQRRALGTTRGVADLVATGTPGGVSASSPGRLPQTGQRVRVEIEGIGAIENPVDAEPVPTLQDNQQ